MSQGIVWIFDMKTPIFLGLTLRALIGLMFSVISYPLCLTASEVPKRWVSTSPQLTELLFQLELGDRLVGTPDQSFYPPQASRIRRIGQLFKPNRESILASNPDLIFWDGSSFEPSLESNLLSMGVSSIKLSLDTTQNVFSACDELIRKFKAGRKTDDLIRAEIEWEFGKRKKKPFSFIALAWGDPPIVFGQKTFLFSLLEDLGGKGILPRNWKTNFLKVSEEWILSQNPTHLIFLKHDEVSALKMKLQCEKWWPKNTPRCVGVSAEKFARASLTPFLSFADLEGIWSPQK